MKSPNSPSSSSGFTTQFAPHENDIYKCVQCGFCLNSCPTYLETGLEAESPRGRLTLMKAVNEGRLELTDQVARHWDLCLQCRACEVACPSGVPYGRAMMGLRAEMAQRVERPWRVRFARTMGFKRILPRPKVMRAVGRATRFFQRSRMRDFVRRNILQRGPAYLASAESAMPLVGDDFFVADGSTTYPVGTPKARVNLLAGCVMTMMDAETMRATVRVLAHNGYEVHVPLEQGCCGSLNLHAGERDSARQMVERNAEAFLSNEPDAIVTVSAGCGSTMKEYGELIPDSAGAEEIADRTKDIHELLVESEVKPPSSPMPITVTFQDPCHLLSTQRISDPPRQLLRLIEGLELVDLHEPNICCGSAGTYSLSQRDMSLRLGDRKARNIAATGAEVVATANPGCMSQLQSSLGRIGSTTRVAYVVDLLDAAYRNGGDYAQTVYTGAGALTSDSEAAEVAAPGVTA